LNELMKAFSTKQKIFPHYSSFKSRFMKQKFSFCFIIGIGLGIMFDNLGAGMCLGIGSSAIVTFLLNRYNNKHKPSPGSDLV